MAKSLSLSLSLLGAPLLMLLMAATTVLGQPSVVLPGMGTVNGTTSSDGLVQLYLGIPYAQAGRWQIARPAAPFGFFAATSFGQICAQVDSTYTPTGGEDCLNINVYVPASAAGQQGVLPVMVWTYGGGFWEGDSRSFHYNATAFVANNNVIVVTYNYRLGPFGFFGMSDLLSESPSTGVYGVDDARAAFTWVKQYIRYFGGDPSQVTAFGESAGGIISCLLAFSPLSAGLFRAVILESGNCDMLTRPQSAVFDIAATFAAQLQCSGPNTLACLRSKTMAQVLNASVAIGGGSSFSYNGQPVPWLPSIDGVLLPQNPLLMLLQGSWRPVPVLLGANRDSFSLFMINTPLQNVNTIAQAQTYIEGLFESPSLTAIRSILGAHAASPSEVAAAKNALMSFYVNTYGSDPRYMLLKALSDNSFLCGTRRMAQGFSQYTNQVYLYEFQHHPSLPQTPAWMGAYHFAEVQFVFGNADFAQWTPAEQQLSRNMQRYWSGFGISGTSPNSGMSMGTFPPMMWPAYNAVTDLTLGLNLTLAVVPGNNNVSCGLWDQLVFSRSAAWPASVSASNARLQPPLACSSSSSSGSSTSNRAGTVAIAVAISVVLVAAAGGLIWLMNRRQNAREITGSATSSSLKYQLYAN